MRAKMKTRQQELHGLSNHPLYHTWENMRQRCSNPKASNYENYGGRGVKVCSRWGSFARFLEDMGEKPSPQHTVDRINVNGNYEPSNCKWATKREQSINSRVNKNNTSGMPGVFWHKAKKRWVSKLVHEPGRIPKTSNKAFKSLGDAIAYHRGARAIVYGVTDDSV